MDRARTDLDTKAHLSLEEAAQFLLGECRTVLPGLQALFGFQLIVVFNDTFDQKLSPVQQDLHLAAIGLAALAIALTMTPAAYHRQKHPFEITAKFMHVSGRLLRWSMPPLAIALTLDFYLIASLVVDGYLAPAIACGIFLVFVVLWFVLPRSARLERLLLGASRKSTPL
jgi:hypothetical protein